MNKLAQYLKETETRQADFAELIGVQQGTVSRLAKGSLIPQIPLALRVERATNMAVDLHSWVKLPEDAD